MHIYNRLHERFGPRHWWPADTDFEIITGAILTQNTAWANVEKAIANLKKKRILTPRKMYKTPTSTLAGLIRPSGYYNIKARRLKAFVNFLFKNYNGSLKKMFSRKTAVLREELLDINGIGPETADSILLYAAEKPVFVVDAYTRRILSRHNLIRPQAGYDDVQHFFTNNLPPDRRLFNEYHALIVELGKTICKKKPRCAVCPIR
jgi:endonuclease-3 related protein